MNAKPTCKLSGCTKTCFFDPKQKKFMDFCSINHRDEFNKQPQQQKTQTQAAFPSSFKPQSATTSEVCLYPTCIEPTNKGFNFCSKNHGREFSKLPTCFQETIQSLKLISQKKVMHKFTSQQLLDDTVEGMADILNTITNRQPSSKAMLPSVMSSPKHKSISEEDIE